MPGRIHNLTNRSMPRRVVLGCAVGLPVLTGLVCALLRSRVTSATVALVLVLWVVAAAATGNRVAGMVAAFAGGLSFDYFFTVPFYQLTIADPNDVVVTVLLVVIGLGVTELTIWGRRQQARGARRSGYLDGVLFTAKAVAAADVSRAALVDLVSGQITDVLGADECHYAPGPLRDPPVALIDHDGFVSFQGRPLDVDRAGLPTEADTAIAVGRGARTLGHFLISAESTLAYPNVEQRRVAVLLADQVASTLTVRNG